ncbi:RPA_interact_C domain-containing protein [Durusdinium trenchii]|uniref:RPA_interact_C domain-containing protein n=1 Tax=Durusdinium trenchii TaxID=1381693 RepID=A0ABP0PD50_9DINO
MAPRAPLKQLGRPSALDALRARCLSRARENREMRLQSKRTELNVLEQPMATEHGLLAKLRGVLQEELRSSPFPFADEDLDHETLLALEEEILRELWEEAQRVAQEEVLQLEEQQNAADAALYEQHLLPGVSCPSCGIGRIELKDSSLLCSQCPLKVPLMDEQLTLEEVAELLGLAELRHDQDSGCPTRGRWTTSGQTAEGAAQSLHYACESCGWKELVL